jgi:predicted nucleotidyltransferase
MINEYQTQSTLNPKLWDGDKLHPKLRVGFMKIAKAFYDFLEVQCDIEDVIIIGSSANYNWTKYSDIDLHLLIDFSNLTDPDISKKYFDSKN